ncbi:MAG: threonine dehydratase [Oleiphilaceae bacterium]|jgi:threonine dehydratase
MAVRSPIEEAFKIYAKGASRIISVSDHEIAHAIRMYFTCTYNVAEVAPLAAALQEKEVIKGNK